jgi:ribonuclease E
MFNPTVQLKSGGYIVIGVTEALVAIDVNSGRATKEGSIEDTATKTNLEAAEEVARQLRLRDLAGLIVIDFIDMDERKNNAAVEKRMKDKLKTDRARIQVGRISGFGLMEMSRQRLRPGMIEATTQPCPSCHGTGLIRSDDNMSLSILRQIEEEGTRRRSREVLVRCPVNIANFLMNQKREHIAQIEARYGLSVRIEGDPHLVSPDFSIEKFKTATRHVPAPSAPVVSVDTKLMDEIDAIEEQQVVEEETTDENDQNGEGGKKRKRKRRRRRKSKGDQNDQPQSDAEVTAEGEGDGDAVTAEGEPQPAQDTDAPVAETGDAAEGEVEAEPKPKRTRTRRSRSKPRDNEEAANEAPADAETGSEPAGEAAGETVEEAKSAKPKRTRTRRKKVEEPVAEETAEAIAPDAEPTPAPAEPAANEAAAERVAEPVAAEPEPVVKEAATEAAPEPVPEMASAAATPEAEPEPASPPKPKRRGWWSLGS